MLKKKNRLSAMVLSVITIATFMSTACDGDTLIKEKMSTFNFKSGTTLGYNTAIEKGYEGSDEDFMQLLLNALKVSGKEEILTVELNGLNGIEGEKGETGDSGTDGKDAYAYALSKGYVGSYSDWLNGLNSIKNLDEIEQSLNKLETLSTPVPTIDIKKNIEDYTKELDAIKNDIAKYMTVTEMDKSISQMSEVINKLQTINNTYIQNINTVVETTYQDNQELLNELKSNLAIITEKNEIIESTLDAVIVEVSNSIAADIAKVKTEAQGISKTNDDKSKEEITASLEELNNSLSALMNIVQLNSARLTGDTSSLYEQLLNSQQNLYGTLKQQKEDLQEAITNGGVTESLNASIALTESKINTSNVELVIIASEVEKTKISLKEKKDTLTSELGNLNAELQTAVTDNNDSKVKELNTIIENKKNELTEATTSLETVESNRLEILGLIEQQKEKLAEELDMTEADVTLLLENNSANLNNTIIGYNTTVEGKVNWLSTTMQTLQSDDKEEIESICNEFISNTEAKITDAEGASLASYNSFKSDADSRLNSVKELETQPDSIAENIPGGNNGISSDKKWISFGVKTGINALGIDGRKGWKVGDIRSTPPEDTSKANWSKVNKQIISAEKPAVIFPSTGYNTGNSYEMYFAVCSKTTTYQVGSYWCNDCSIVGLYPVIQTQEAYMLHESAVYYGQPEWVCVDSASHYASECAYEAIGDYLGYWDYYYYYSAPLVAKNNGSTLGGSSAFYTIDWSRNMLPCALSLHSFRDSNSNYGSVNVTGGESIPLTYTREPTTYSKDRNTLEDVYGSFMWTRAQNTTIVPATPEVSKYSIPSTGLTAYQKYKLSQKGLDITNLPSTYANNYIYVGTPYLDTLKLGTFLADASGVKLQVRASALAGTSGTYSVGKMDGTVIKTITLGTTGVDPITLIDTIPEEAYSISFTADANSYSQSKIYVFKKQEDNTYKYIGE